eukprot:jgi/Chlat1/1448/Chrsp12S02066
MRTRLASNIMSKATALRSRPSSFKEVKDEQQLVVHQQQQQQQLGGCPYGGSIAPAEGAGGSGNPEERQHAAQCIADITQGNTTNRLLLVGAGAIETLITALASPTVEDDDKLGNPTDARLYVVEALWWIADEAIDAVRERVVQAGCLPSS